MKYIKKTTSKEYFIPWLHRRYMAPMWLYRNIFSRHHHPGQTIKRHSTLRIQRVNHLIDHIAIHSILYTQSTEVWKQITHAVNFSQRWNKRDFRAVYEHPHGSVKYLSTDFDHPINNFFNSSITELNC